MALAVADETDQDFGRVEVDAVVDLLGVSDENGGEFAVPRQGNDRLVSCLLVEHLEVAWGLLLEVFQILTEFTEEVESVFVIPEERMAENLTRGDPLAWVLLESHVE